MTLTTHDNAALLGRITIDPTVYQNILAAAQGGYAGDGMGDDWQFDHFGLGQSARRAPAGFRWRRPDQRPVTDPAASGTKEFYTVEIVKP